MNDQNGLSRSPEMMSTDGTMLLVVDVQERLLPHIAHRAEIVWNIGRLIDGAKILGIPVRGTEQYPRGLGGTVAALADRLGPLPDKATFSCRGCSEVFRDLERQGIHCLLVVGVETHVCVQQTVLDLLAAGFQTFVAADAVGSRRTVDYQFALRRIEASGAIVTTTEAVLMEWCESADRPEFKAISRLVKPTGPESASC